ncbi:terminase large subunit domain-containing protein [Siphonobacter sp. SORGH_AS_1065]|uniref:terminase large subunit domain-containing protein n=1 Tax=Siphonobacter sp. SORGH_AS_1065 TaxID=3041795 RepID=UPI0027890770|nr:terminase family protein [Siphonobacter sp. SORGH_AS_1065]MDQ1085632.1 hypothetical protein [Siphonobacter sp. SORGH_AS_1065]
MEELEITVNDKQGDFLEAVLYGMDVNDRKVAGMVGGIGSGKSIAMSDLLATMKEELPRAKGQFACPVVSQAKRSLTPGLRAGWRDRWDITEFKPATGEGEYVLWKKPPEDFDLPYEEPDDWSNCISFANGFVIELCGYKMDADSHRGRNDDFVVMDEALRFKKDWLKILLGRIRANVGRFQSNLHWLFAFFSSPPYGSQGDWMYEYEELAKKDPKRYHFTQVITKDNEVFLPPGFISSLKDKLTALEYSVEVEGKRLSSIPKSYYSALDWDKHSDIDGLPGLWYDPDKPLESSGDFNVLFTSSTIYQREGRLIKGQKALFVKEPMNNPDTGEALTMVETLAYKVAEVYKGHRNKKIYVTGDRNGNNKSPGATKTMYELFAQALESEGWEVILCPLLYNMEHYERFLLMHKVLSEKDADEYYLRMHPTEFKPALVSMTYTPIKADYTKDKGSEKKLSVEQENATHLGDTVDYYVIWCSMGGATYSESGFEIDFF